MPEEDQDQRRKLVLAFDAKRLFNNFTGLGNYSRTLVRNLHRFFPEHEYHLFTPRIIKNEETAYFLEENRFIIHTPKRFNPLWRTWFMSSEINLLKPDIFHGLSHEIPFGIHQEIKTIVTFHDLIYEKFPDQFGWWDKKMYHLKYKSAAHRTDHIIAISNSTKQDLIETYQIPENKIEVLYQSCHEDYQSELNAEGELPLEIAGLQNYYLFVGSLIERKGLMQVVLAYALLPEEYRKPVVVIGNGRNSYVDKIKGMIRYHHLENDFYFLKKVTNEGLVSVYDHCFVLVLPSVYEGFGIPVIEALFRHKPVITSDISSLPEAAGPGGILVNPYSPRDISTAMAWVHDSKVYENLASKGRSWAKDHFSAEKTSMDLMDFYYSILT